MLPLLFLLFSNSNTENRKADDAFTESYHVYSVSLPEELTFAGEPISLSDPDYQERYDRELLTNIYWQSQSVLFIKRAHKYLPVIEPILKAEGIPDDFKYLALAESGLLFNVVSPSNAVSWWQFLEGTAKRYGLQVNDEVDERFHLEKSTHAACRYFREAHLAFGSWSLAALSYNMGIEGLRKQVALQRATGFSDLYLNNETIRYLFRILAIKAVVEHPEQYGFHIPYEARYKSLPTVTVVAAAPLKDIALYAKENNSNYRWIKLLNPWMRKNTLTVLDTPYTFAFPKSAMADLDYAGLIVNDSIRLEQTHWKP